MALKLDSTINNILEEISKKNDIDKQVVYLMLDYRFKKIRDVIKSGKTRFDKIKLNYFMTFNFQESKFDNYDKKFNRKVQEDSKGKLENNNRLLGDKKLF